MRVKLFPVPGVQLAPLSALYSQMESFSMALTLIVTILVIPSVADAPESVCSAMTGAAGGVVSMVMAALFWLVVVLPARSVCLTLTAPIS